MLQVYDMITAMSVVIPVVIAWGSKMGLWLRISGWGIRVVVGGFVLVMTLLAVLPTAASAQSFTDVKGDEWFAPAVEALAAQGIVYGHYDGSFAPNDAVTRAQLMAFLARALHLQDSAVAPFTDVTIQDWYFGAVAAMYEAGLISGTGPATFSPNAAGGYDGDEFSRLSAREAAPVRGRFHSGAKPGGGLAGWLP
jgi:hypothetical protein